MLNKNIIQLTLFILLIILASILLNYLYYLIIPDEESNSLKEIKKYHKDNSIDILFLGDSHPKFAVNPKFIDNKNVYNFSIATINYISIYHNLEILLNKENIKVQNIIIEIDPHNFSEKKFQVTPLKNYKFYSKYYSQNYISKINNENIYTTFKKSIIQSYFGYIGNYYNILTKTKSIILNQKETNYKGWKAGISQLKDKKSVKLRIENSFNNDYKESKLGYDYFEKTIKLANNNNINIIFIKYPLSKNYINLLNKDYNNNYIEKVKNIIIKNGIKFKLLDFSNFNSDKNNLFNDPDHLNIKGSEIFSKELNNKIKKLGK